MTKKIIGGLLFATLFFTLNLPVFAAKEERNNGNQQRQADLPCMITAVDTRDSAIIAAWETFSGSVKTALQTRKDALKAAWAKTDKKERKEAIKTAWNNYKSAIKTARKALNEARKAAWKKFNSDRKICRGQGEDTSNESHDSNL